jgi:hypothetical protein
MAGNLDDVFRFHLPASDADAARQPHDLPDDIATRVAAREGKRSNLALRAIAQDPRAMALFEQSFRDIEKRARERENPHTKRARKLTVVTWHEQLKIYYPDMPEVDYWIDDTIRKWAVRHLHLRVRPCASHHSRFSSDAKPSGVHDAWPRWPHARQGVHRQGMAHDDHRMHRALCTRQRGKRRWRHPARSRGTLAGAQQQRKAA